jgi:uncharacterized membrane protein
MSLAAPFESVPTAQVTLEPTPERATGTDVKVVSVGAPGPIARRGAWLLLETVLIPMALLYVTLRMWGPMVGLSTVLAWRLGFTVGRVAIGHRVPATVVLTTSIFCVRTIVSLSFASVALYLWQPVIMSAGLGLVFIGTALAGRPVTEKLARDVVTLPSLLRHDPRVQRIFKEVAVLLGLVQVGCAALGAWTLQGRIETVVIVHGCLGVLTVLASVAVSVGWVLWRSRALSDIRIRFGDPDGGSTA